MNHFSALCRSRNHREYREYDRQSRHSQREPHKSRNSSRSSSHDSSRSNSRSRHNKSSQHSNRYSRSPTPFKIHSITTSIQKPTDAANTDSTDKLINKRKDRCPSPLIFNFSDLDSSTCDELAFSDTEVCTNYTDFLPSQDHTNHLPGPSCITEANDTQDQNSTAYSELPISDTETENSYTLQPEDTNFSPLQDHIAHLPRPPCSPRPTRQHL